MHRTPEELLRAAGINLKRYAPGRYTVLCPRCSHTRTGAHRKHPVLGVTIEPDKVHWGCNHCDFKGPEKGSAPRGNGDGRGDWTSTKTFYRYGDNRKVRTNGGTPPFYWQHLDEAGNWVKGAKNTNDLMYHIEKINGHDMHNKFVIVAEGEKDVDNLWKLGFPATCNANGASQPGKAPKWTKKHA